MSTSPSPRGGALLLAILLATPPVLAQQTPPPASPPRPDAIETIEVYGRRGASLTAASVEEAHAALARTPGAVSLVAAEAFRDRYALNLRDMLALTPGVYAQQRFAEEVRVSVRGSGLSRGFHMRGLQLLIDGVPVNLADGSADFQEIDPKALRYLEVWRGGNALRYGAAGLGGAINMVTPTGRTAEAPNRLSLEVGDHGTVRAFGSVARGWDGGDAFGYAGAVRADGWRQQSRQESQRLGGNAGLRLSPIAETRVYLTANRIKQELPGTLTLAQALDRPRTASAASLSGDQARDIRSLRLSNRTSVQLGGMAVDVGAYLNRKELFHPIFQVIDQDSLDTGGFIRLEGETRLGAMRAAYVGGLNLRQGRTDARQYVNRGGNRGPLTALSVQRARNIEAYGEGRLYLRDDLAIVAGAQALAARRAVDNILDPAQTASRSFDAVSPKLGLLWDIGPDIQAWANVTRAVEAPTFSELIQAPVPRFVPIRLQEAVTWEAGTRGKAGRFGWDVTLYRAEIDGEMLQFSVAPDIPAATFNAGETVHQGVEAALSAALAADLLAAGDALTLSGSWLLNDFFFDGDRQFGDNALPAIPDTVLQARLRYGRAEAHHLELGVEWVPEGAWVDYANTLRAPGYAVWSVSAGATLAPGVSLFAEMRNLLDRAHVSNFGAIVNARAPGANLAIFYPGEGRSLYAGLKLEF